MVSSKLLDRELKRGSTELLILALVEQRPRHGYEISQRSVWQTFFSALDRVAGISHA